MSVSIAEFDTTNVDPAGDFTPVPDGKYTVAITNSDRRESRATPGCFYLSVECEILEGEYKGRKLFDNLNLWHESQKAAEMAIKTLKAIQVATNQIDSKDFGQMHNIPITVKVKCVKRQDNGEMKNEIKAYLPPDIAQLAPGRRRSTPQTPDQAYTPTKPDMSFLDE